MLIEYRYYAGLGAVGDFSDELLIFAFQCQTRVDDANSPYYFECLQDLAIGRKSDRLETQVQIFASEGYTNRREVEEAYRFIGMEPSHAHHITDEHIIGQFKSRLADISPSAVIDTRNALRIIGFARNSKKIQEEASNAIETYSQALSWLGLMEDQPDDFVITMYTIKVGIISNLAHFLRWRTTALEITTPFPAVAYI
jgi:ubiquitin carboxyl-terminal hydrolase 25/28